MPLEEVAATQIEQQKSLPISEKYKDHLEKYKDHKKRAAGEGSSDKSPTKSPKRETEGGMEE
jgi:hypothetical protein